MDINFDVKKVFQERLALSFGLDRYEYVIHNLHTTNVQLEGFNNCIHPTPCQSK